ncbi:MAG: YajQ family cyclic di-GMP-binding protein [Deltaproteobacteria bacterium]|nr:YajQ family cyclic di-GMP-binding protein [Deltaproteobacteria bacterium]
MPSFDVVSKVQWNEIDNALGQAQKELAQRFDFQGTDARVEKQLPEGLLVTASTEDRVRAAIKVLEDKLVKRKVSLKHIEVGDPSSGPKGSSKVLVKVKEGIETEKAREIVKLLKESKLKVQAAIQEQQVRVTGKNKDDLQATIKLLRGQDLGIELQFVNFRD